jgi:nickel/cobalt transporter (NicO) family protein
MVRALVLVVALALTLGLEPSDARTNPFTGKPAAPEINPLTGERAPALPEQTAEGERAWGPIAVVGRALLTFQRDANRLIATHMRAIRDGETSVPLLIGAGLAFLYGVVHALGPGHGKLVVVTYFLAHEARVGRGLLMACRSRCSTSSRRWSWWRWPTSCCVRRSAGRLPRSPGRVLPATA